MIDHPTGPRAGLKILGILGCTMTKIWGRSPTLGPMPAKDVYQGKKFLADLENVEALTTRWIILSAKYGFMDPDFIIPGPYDVTFHPRSDSSEPPISISALMRQVRDFDLGSFDVVRLFSSCGYCYEKKVRESFHEMPVHFERVDP